MWTISLTHSCQFYFQSVLRIRQDHDTILRGIRTRREHNAIVRTRGALDTILKATCDALQALDDSLEVTDPETLHQANLALARVNRAFTHYHTVVRNAPSPATYTDAEVHGFCTTITAIRAELRAVSVALHLVLSAVSRILIRAV